MKVFESQEVIGNKVTILSCKLKVEQDLGREKINFIFPPVKILTHGEEHGGGRGKKVNLGSSMRWACTKINTQRRKKIRRS